MKRQQYFLIASALVALAFGLRLWGLTATSLWYDETFMLYHAQQGVVDGVLGLLREDNALPLHGLLLALWVGIAGSGEFAARYLSVLLGTIAAPLVLRLGGALTGRRFGGWGAALAYATLPIHVYYAQEVRMYALVVPLAAAFAWTAWRLVEKGRGAGAYLVLGAAMLLAHLYAGLLWAAILVWGSCGLWVAGYKSKVESRKSKVGNHASRITQLVPVSGDHASRFTHHVSRFTFHAWLRANLLLACAALPIGAWALWRARVDATAVSAIPATALRWIPVLFGVGQYLPEPWTTAFVVVAVLALIAALIGLTRAKRGTGALWLTVTLALPVLLLLAATFVKAKWSERYLLPSLGLALVTGVGTGWEFGVVGCGLWVANPKFQVQNQKSKIEHPASCILHLASCILLTGWLALTVPALARQAQGTWAVGLTDEWHPRPDFRGVARYIETVDAPEDAIVVIGGYAAHTLDYYYDGPAHLFGLPLNARVLDTQRPLDLRALTTLQQQTASADRLWLVLWQDTLTDPTALVLSTLVDACHRLPVDAHFTNIGVARFDLTTCRPLDRLAAPPRALAVDFVEPIRLVGYDLVKIDESWEVNLWWKTSGLLLEDYHVFVHLIGGDGGLVAQHDHIAGADAYPTSRWSPGTFLRDRFFLTVPGGVCDHCVLHVGLYTETERLLLQDGEDDVEITLTPE